MLLCRASARLWKQGGMESVHEQPLDIEMSFEPFADYWDVFLLGQGPAGAYVRSVDGGRLRALRDEVKGRLPEDQPFALPARVWAVRGTVPFRP